MDGNNSVDAQTQDVIHELEIIIAMRITAGLMCQAAGNRDRQEHIMMELYNAQYALGLCLSTQKSNIMTSLSALVIRRFQDNHLDTLFEGLDELGMTKDELSS